MPSGRRQLRPARGRAGAERHKRGAPVAEIAAGIKASYPTASLLALVNGLQGRGFAAHAASFALRDVDPTLTAVQTGILLARRCESSARPA